MVEAKRRHEKVIIFDRFIGQQLDHDLTQASLEAIIKTNTYGETEDTTR